MKEKIKDFVKEHKKAIAVAASIGVAYAVGYKAGDNIGRYRVELGLQKCFKVNPELEPMMWEAIGKVEKHNG